jgi:hypothetical protein
MELREPRSVPVKALETRTPETLVTTSRTPPKAQSWGVSWAALPEASLVRALQNQLPSFRIKQKRKLSLTLLTKICALIRPSTTLARLRVVLTTWRKFFARMATSMRRALAQVRSTRLKRCEVSAQTPLRQRTWISFGRGSTRSLRASYTPPIDPALASSKTRSTISSPTLPRVRLLQVQAPPTLPKRRD